LWSLSPIKRKGKRLVRRTILFLGTMLVMLLVAAGVAFAAANYYYCSPNLLYCRCPEGTVCVGTAERDDIYGTDTEFGDKIFAKDGDDNIHAEAGGDYVDAGPGDDFIQGDAAGGLSGSGNDTLIGGDGVDEIYGYGGYDECYGGPGVDYLDPSCEKRVQ
jgi:Ca2+-binding RTX toxin-like protein